jgi:hypothetical protein
MESKMERRDHSLPDRSAPAANSFWASKAFLICVAFLVIGGILLWTEHLAHAFGYLPYLLLLACPLLHILMHAGYGDHSHGRADRDLGQSQRDKP